MWRWMAAGAAALILSGAAIAQDGVMDHYAAYQDALAEGRSDDAVRAGQATWRAAETEWGESRETGVLAFNIASLLVRLSRSEEAIEPARRALELSENGVAAEDVPEDDAQIVLGLAEFGASGGEDGGRRLADA